MSFIREHRKLVSILALLLIVLPGAIDAWWSLSEKMGGVVVMDFPIAWPTLIITSIIFLMLAIILAKTWHEEVASPMPKVTGEETTGRGIEPTQTKEIHEVAPTLKRQLLALLDEGRKIEKQCLDEGSPLPIAPAENWRKRTHALLEGQVAQYIADIWDDPGFDPLLNSSVQEGPSSAEHRELWMPIAARVRRLENILRGFGS